MLPGYDGRPMKIRSHFPDNEAGSLYEAGFKTMFQMAAIGMGQVDPRTGEILIINPKFCEITGYSELELIGKHFAELSYPEDHQDDLHKFRRLVAGEIKEYQSQKRLVRKDKKIIHVHSNVSLICHPDGSPFRVLSVIQDMTELVQSKESLQANQEQLEMALDASEAGTWLWDVKAGKIIWSERLEKLFGLEPKSFSGDYEDYMKLIHPDDREYIQQTVQNAIASKKPYSMEHRVCWPDGSVHWLLGKGKAFYDEAGNLIRMTGTTCNINEKKARDAELLRKTQELDQFAAIAAHDLKAPLNSVIGFARLLSEEFQNQFQGEAQRYLGFILSAGDRMTRMIDGLLAYARAQESSSSQTEKVCMSYVLSEVQKNLSSEISQTKAQIKIQDPMPLVQANEMQLIQVVQNLMANAIKYRKPQLPPEIGVYVTEKPEFWQFSIQDNGIGIEPKNLNKIFDFFLRIEGQKTEGSGIGLAVCKKIILHQKGEIWAESVAGEGSQFFFTIPK